MKEGYLEAYRIGNFFFGGCHLFSDNGCHFMLSANGCVMIVDDELLESIRKQKPSEELQFKLVQHGLASVPGKQMFRCEKEVEVRYFIIDLTKHCNFDCIYCFRNFHNTDTISFDVLEKILQYILNYCHKELVIENTEKMEQVLKQAAKVLANNTNYATLVSAPDVNHNKVKFIQLSQVDDQHLLAVIVMNNNMVRNKMLDLYEPLDNETILKLNILLNTSLNGLAMNEINLGNIASIKERAGIHSGIVSDVIDALAQTFAESEDLKIYTSGATNILKYPELSDSNNAATLLSAFEEKEELASLVTESLSDSEKKDNGTGIQVYIGNESPIQTMKDCSVVTATYDLGEGVKGTIGIVGPKRMDYEKVMDNLKTLKSQLDGIYKKSEDET